MQPSGITQTYWPKVREKCAELGLSFDRWQDGAGRLILAQRQTGKFAAGIGGAVLSWPRQVGKTYLIGAIIVALCLLRPNMLALWTAHHGKTINETFRSMQSMVKRRAIWRHVKQVRTGNGDEGIEFKNGSRILFGARDAGFGLGFTGVSLLVFDEAQRLSQRAIDDMIPTTNTGDNPLVFFIGTPPRPTDGGEAFTNRRKKALAVKAARERGEDPRSNVLYIELGADPTTDRTAAEIDWEQLAKANPSFPHRVPADAIERMWELLGPDSFWREGYGIWDEIEALNPAIDPFAWRDQAVRKAPSQGVKSYGVKFSPDGVSVSLSAALRHDGGVHVETIARAPLTDGTWWIVEWFTKDVGGRQRHQDAAQIVIDGKAGAVGLTNDLRAAGVPARVLICSGDVGKVGHLTTDNVIAANSMLREAVKRKTVTHLQDPDVLDASVVGTTQRKIGTAGGWGFQPKTDDDDSTPVESAALAHWAAMTSKRRPGRTTRGRVLA